MSRFAGRGLGAALVVAAVLWASDAAACAISTTSVAFGVYNPFSSANVDSTGTVTWNCPLGTVSSGVTVTLDKGGAGTFAGRRMTIGFCPGGITCPNLGYQLYLDAARTSIWGDGTEGTSVYTQGAPVPLNQNIVLTVYGRITGSQDVSAGSYSNSVTVTITW